LLKFDRIKGQEKHTRGQDLLFFQWHIVKSLLTFVHDRIHVSAKMRLFLEMIVDSNIQTELEAAAFRELVKHLQTHTEVQNIELMILADFCRNCLAKWYAAAAKERDIALDYEQAREVIYGMPYQEWKDKYQTEATAEQLAAYQAKQQGKA
jgi:hypothetical protein